MLNNLEQWCERKRVSFPGLVLAAVFAADLLLAGLIVGGVSLAGKGGGTAGAVSPVSSAPPTIEDLRARLKGIPMADAWKGFLSVPDRDRGFFAQPNGLLTDINVYNYPLTTPEGVVKKHIWVQGQGGLVFNVHDLKD